MTALYHATRRQAANVAAGLTVTCKRCAFVYRKGWGTMDGFCCQTRRELAGRGAKA